MSVITEAEISPALVTPEELLQRADSVNFELVDGQLVERAMGTESSGVGAQILGLLWAFLKDHPLGRLLGADAGYQCFLDAPDKIRKPDVSFIKSGRLPGDKMPAGYCKVRPDLVVEVVSPTDQVYELEEKVAEYLRAGVPLIWVVNPPTRSVRIHRPRTAAQGSVSEVTESDLISGEDVLPGFSCSVAEFFV